MSNKYRNKKRLQRPATMLNIRENGFSINKTLKWARLFHKKEDTPAFKVNKTN